MRKRGVPFWTFGRLHKVHAVSNCNHPSHPANLGRAAPRRARRHQNSYVENGTTSLAMGPVCGVQTVTAVRSLPRIGSIVYREHNRPLSSNRASLVLSSDDVRRNGCDARRPLTPYFHWPTPDLRCSQSPSPHGRINDCEHARKGISARWPGMPAHHWAEWLQRRCAAAPRHPGQLSEPITWRVRCQNRGADFTGKSLTCRSSSRLHSVN